MKAGVLALQGDFREHGRTLAEAGATPVEVRNAEDLAGVDCLVIPGGESTTMAKLAHAYDLVVNGNELGGGSFRIHEPELQAEVFDLMKLSPDEQRVKFGFLLDALAMGAPPMGGIAFGIDRMTMVLAGEPNLRDVIAFPKNQAGVDPMSGAPSEVTEEQLRELGIRLAVEPEPRPPAGT